MAGEINWRIHYDRADVESAVRGHELDALARFTAIPHEHMDGKHHPCVACGGKDRFRVVVKQNGDVFVLCNQCFSKHNGDTIAAIVYFGGRTLDETCSLVGRAYNATPSNGKFAPPGDKPATDSPESIEQRFHAILAKICKEKGIPHPESLLAYGARLGSRGKHLTVRLPVYDEHGAQIESSYFDLISGKKGWFKKGASAGLFLLGQKLESSGYHYQACKPEPGEQWCVVEGPKDAAALHGLGFKAIGLPGKQLNPKYAELLKGVHLVLVPDRDMDSLSSFHKAAEFLEGTAAGVKIAELPAPLTESKGQDVRDILKQPNGEQRVKDSIGLAVHWSHVKVTPEITVTPSEETVASEAIMLLTKTDNLYQRGGMLVHVITDGKSGRINRPESAPQIAPIPHARLRELMSSAAMFFLPPPDGGDGERKRIHVPRWSVEAVMARGQWSGIRHLEGVVQSPVLRPDGTVLQTPGYDDETGLLFVSQQKWPQVPNGPTREQAKEACEDLLEVVCDFPFINDAHRAAWLTAAITPFARYAFEGPAPLFAIDANAPGTGKSLLADSIAMISTGDVMARTAAPAKDEEMRKLITSIVIGGEQLVLFDNVAHEFGCPSLDAALTGTTWSDRILGQTKMTGRFPLSAIFFLTGNNVVLVSDTARRALHIRIESRDENPEEREGFRYPSLLPWVKVNQPRLSRAALTMLSGYIAADRPKLELPEWGSFEGWSRLVRHTIVWLGLPDPCFTRLGLREKSDQTMGQLRLLIAGWEEVDPSRSGLRVSDSVALLNGETGSLYPTMREAIMSISPRLNVRTIGIALKKLEGRVTGGKFLTCEKSGNVNLWKVNGMQ